MCPAHFFWKHIFLLCFNNIVCPFGLMAETPQNKKCQRFLIKVSNIGTYKTYSYTKANTINFRNTYVVLCLRYIHFNYIVYSFNEKQNMKACFNLVLCSMLVTFLTEMWSDFWESTKAGPITSAFAFLNTSCGFTENFLTFLTPDPLSSPLCMW